MIISSVLMSILAIVTIIVLNHYLSGSLVPCQCQCWGSEEGRSCAVVLIAMYQRGGK